MAVIGALIISYNPDIEKLIKNISAIESQVNKTIVVDNGSSNQEYVLSLMDSRETVEVVCCEENEGIAAALNKGMQHFWNTGFDWVLTLDQDSTCPPNLITVLSNHVDNPELGIACPDINYGNGKWVSKFGNKPIYIQACMTSASLTRVEAWHNVNGYDESYFIDFVDNDFCMKLRLHGYKVLRDFNAVLQHQLGNTKDIILFGKHIKYSEHSPLRTYYMVRNNAFFIRKYRANLNVFRELMRLVYIICNVLCFSQDRISHIRSIKKAFLDYSHFRMGKYTGNICR